MPISREFSPAIRFSYEGGARGTRRHPFQVGWRRLPGALFERPDGGNWILEIEGRPSRTVRSGEIMVIPRGVVHRLRMEGVRTMQTDWMMVNFEGLGGMDLLAAARIPLVLSRSTGRRLSELMAVLRDLDPSARQGDLIALARHQVTGFCILEILLEHAEVRSLAPTDPGLERLLPVLQYVEANLVRPISMASLAKQMSLSPSRFHCVFTRVMGIPPMSYVQDARLRMAQRLLLTSSKPVGEIAALTGFSSPYYFSRFFRQRLKTTPTAFRHDPNWFSNTL